MKQPELIKNIHYYIDELGRWVFTAQYLTERGYCCQSGCRHCPYGFKKEQKKKRNPAPKK
ncbi:MAG TPA: DUF5522 domain-containing protein [Chitinophagales bacterium]|nr:DUF5522 domain-containing protein [Chitinophagales bacterium]